MPGNDDDTQRDERSREISETTYEKTMKKLGKSSAKTMKKLAKRRELPRLYEDYINEVAPQLLTKRSLKHIESKGDYLLHDFEENVFDWENKATKKPAFDAFKNVFDGFDKLRRTFSAKQKEIVDETDFGKNMAIMVALMRQQIEASERTARTQSRRFLASLAIAAVSVIVAVIRIVL